MNNTCFPLRKPYSKILTYIDQISIPEVSAVNEAKEVSKAPVFKIDAEKAIPIAIGPVLGPKCISIYGRLRIGLRRTRHRLKSSLVTNLDFCLPSEMLTALGGLAFTITFNPMRMIA